ncbi:MAG: hypothetical protein WBB29_16485 [Geitlerinemataceae cyanobacterium]
MCGRGGKAQVEIWRSSWVDIPDRNFYILASTPFLVIPAIAKKIDRIKQYRVPLSQVRSLPVATFL